MTTVAIDVMSGDEGCRIAIAAARRVKLDYPAVNIILVGDATTIKASVTDVDFPIEQADEVVAMDEQPSRAIRRRRTSMRRALELVASGEAEAAVSAGNTGALLGLGMLVLKVIDGIDRPAIASFVPNRNATDSCCMLDLGANIECTPKMLLDFAVMGSDLTEAVKQRQKPRVGLLNIGEESSKGSKTLHQAAALMAADSRLNFIGNVEGYGMYDGSADVIVCDGFTGNVALKVSEGLARMIGGMVRDAFRQDFLARCCGFLALPVINRLRDRMDHRAYNGACFVGLRGIVVKSHGHADEKAFAAAIRYAIKAAEESVPTVISHHSNNTR